MEKPIYTHLILEGTSLRRGLLGRTRKRWQAEIKLPLKEMASDNTDQNDLAHILDPVVVRF
jgi:hypothetical protein